MTTALSATLPEAVRDYKEFKRAPTDTQVVIHGISLEATSNEEDSLYTVMKESLFLGQQVNISSARFLQKDPKIRATKWYTSVVVSLPTDDVEKNNTRCSRIRKTQILCGHVALESYKTMPEMLLIRTS